MSIKREIRKDKRKERRAERKLNRADKLFTKGKDERAYKKIEKAEDIVDDISTLDTTDLKQDIEDYKNTNWTNEFDIISSIFKNKIKIKDFEYIKKVKINGKNISQSELMNFFNTIKNFIENVNISDIDKKSIHIYNNFEIDVINRKNTIIFKYKERNITDKIKLFVEKDNIINNKQDIINEINKLIKSKSVNKSITNINKEKVNEPIVNTNEPQITKSIIIPEIKEVISKGTEIIKYNNTFVDESVKLLIEQKLYQGALSTFSNVNETKIYNYFVVDNYNSCLNSKNIDNLCISYKQKTSKTNESIVDSIKRSTKGLLSKEPEGFVKDMIFAFNTDESTLIKDMNVQLYDMNRRLTTQLETEIYKHIIAGGVLIKSAAMNTTKNVLTSATKLSYINKYSNVFKGLKTLSIKQLTGRAIIRSIANAIKIVPLWGWIVAGAIEGFFFYQKMSKQQSQIATIFSLMYMSNSHVFKKELNDANINLTLPDIEIDYDKIENKLKNEGYL